MMDDIAEQQDVAKEISEAISNPVAFGGVSTLSRVFKEKVACLAKRILFHKYFGIIRDEGTETITLRKICIDGKIIICKNLYTCSRSLMRTSWKRS